MSQRRPRARKAAAPADPLADDFGPGVTAEPDPPAEPRIASGPLPGIACAGDACLLKPVADLMGKFTLRLSRGHGASLTRAAFSALELMKALRDFLDEEIALAERRKGGERPRYSKIPVE